MTTVNNVKLRAVNNEGLTVEDFIKETTLTLEDSLEQLNETLVEKGYEEIKPLTMTDLEGLILSLASSQGFYGRLYAQLMEIKEEDEFTYEQVKNEWEGKEFYDVVDFILYLEC